MNYALQKVGFHNVAAVKDHYGYVFGHFETEFTYVFENFFHPFLGELIAKLNKDSVEGLLDPTFHESLRKLFFTGHYTPATGKTTKVTSFAKEIDLREGGPYAGYNWELLFHVPLTIAVHLSKNQKFAEAQRWFHYIFDPTSTDTSVAPPARFWKFLLFRRPTDIPSITELLKLLSKPDAECDAKELEQRDRVLSGYEAIRNRPFMPHAVARTRPAAYQYAVVMKYLDNLIAWGDSLFAQDTIESINEATQRYVLAANLLGPKPQQVPQRGTVRPKSYAQLKAGGLDAMSNALVDLEVQFPFNTGTPPAGGSTDAGGTVFGIGRTLYFCIPRNDKLLGYWDTVADRLFKIRHCMNLQGVVRQLALFDPPLDPAMLVKAAAAGIDIGSIVSGLNQPISPVRCQVLIQKSLELAGEVQKLGSALLSAIEKGDAEHLARLRQGHERTIQRMTLDVKFLHWKAAEAATESLLKSRASALERYKFYQRQLGLPVDTKVVPDALPIDRRVLTEENFDEAYAALVGQYDRTIATNELAPLQLVGDDAPSNQAGATGPGGLRLIEGEDKDLNTHQPRARDERVGAIVSDAIFQVLSFLPLFSLNVHFWGVGGKTDIAGGPIFAGAGKIISGALTTAAQNEESKGASAVKSASYERRVDDWKFQSNTAGAELMHVGRQILQSLIAEQVARHEHEILAKQMEHSQEIDAFLHDKFSNEELYSWMQGEISRLYYEYYRLAVDTAKKAERTMKQELLRPELDGTDFVKVNYWDGGRKGLLSGEALFLDVKRMELAYHENNRRELEITRHVSLRQLDPLALLKLRTTGTCELSIPEWLYDRDCPGHYLRRIKSVALSLPSVVGPYASVHCTATLLRSRVRKSAALKGGVYRSEGPNDDRFINYVGSVQSVVTSSGSNDAGLFEVPLKDDRFLPFEHAGAVGDWKLSLPADLRAFDYMTISDAILHIRYTARSGGDALGDVVAAETRDLLNVSNSPGLGLFFALRHDFPTEWAAFRNGTGELALRIRKDCFPYAVQSETLALQSIELHAPKILGLAKRTIAIPTDFADDLNGPDGSALLSIAADSTLLKRTAPHVFLLLRYAIE